MRIIVAAIIQKGDEFLLVKQAKGAYHEGLWGFPGGRVETGEVLESAVKREVKEETDLDVSVGGLFHAIVPKNENILVLFFRCEALAERVRPGDDVEEFAWVTLEGTHKYWMRPAMYDVIEKLK